MAALKDEAGVIVQVPAVPRSSAPSESRFHDVLPATAGDTVKTRPADGVTLPLAELSALYPAEFKAATVNVYAVPLVNPVIVIGEDEPVAVIPPGEDVTR